MGLIDFVKGAWDEAKNVVSDIKDFLEVPIREVQNSGITLPIGDGIQIMKGNEQGVSDVINTQNIPVAQVNTDTIKNMQNIFSDNKVTAQEKQYISTLPEAYQNIFKASKTLDQLKSYVYNPEFLKADPAAATKMKEDYNSNLQNLNYNLKRIEELDPGHAQNQELDKQYFQTEFQKATPKMKDLEDIFGKNTDVANAYNKTVYNSISDVSDLITQARDNKLQDDPYFVSKIESLKKMKDQLQNVMYLKTKNNASQIKDWNDAFDLISNDDSAKMLAQNITDTEEDIRQDLMKKSVAKTYEENKPILGTYKGAEYLLSFVTRGLDEVIQQVAPVKATDLSDLEYLSQNNGVIKNAIGKTANRAIRNGGELAQLFVPVEGLVKGAQIGIKGVMDIGKAVKFVDAAADASKVINSLNNMDKAFNLVKGTVGIDSMFDYNLSAGMSDANTSTNILFNVIGEGLPLIKGAIKDYKEAGITKLKAAEFDQAYKNASFDVAIDGADASKTVKVNMFDLLGAKGDSVNDIIRAAGDGAKIDTETFRVSLNNALDKFTTGLVAGEKAVEPEARAFIRSVFEGVANTLTDMGERTKLLNGIEGRIATRDGLISALYESKKVFNDVAKSEAGILTDMVKYSQGSFNELGFVPVENMEKLVNHKQNFVKAVADHFTGKNISEGTRTVVDKILSNVNETGKVSDSHIMGLIRAFNEGFAGGTAEEYMKKLQEFSQNTLNYVPEGLKSIESIKKIGALAETKFLDNIKAAKINVKFEKLGTGIGGTFKDGSAIISLYKGFYKNPDDFVIGFVHELTHGLINKESKLYTEMAVKYSEGVAELNTKFASLYDGFDIKNLDVKKLQEKGFSQDEIDYLKTYGYRFKNTDEFIAYNVSESLVGKAPSEAFEILKTKVKAVADVAFDGKVTDDMFKVAGDKLMNGRFKASSAKPSVARDIDNYIYSESGRRLFSSDINDIAKANENIGSIASFQKLINDTDAETLAANMKNKDVQIYKMLVEASKSDDPLVEEFIKQSALNGMISGNRGYEAMVSGGLFEVFGDFQTYVKLSDSLESPEKMIEYFEKGQGQISSIVNKIDFMLNNIPYKGDKQIKIQKTLTDLRAMSQYYAYVDVIAKIGNREGFDGIKRFVMSKIEDLTTFGGEKISNVYGMKRGQRATEVLSRGMSDIVKDLQSEIGTKGVELHDYLLRSLTKAEILNPKIESIGFGVWKEVVNALGFKVVNKATVPQDVFNMLADANYIKSEESAGTLYGLGKLFGFDDTKLKGNYSARQSAIAKILGGAEFKDAISSTAKGAEPKVSDVLNFLNLKDFELIDANVGTIFDTIYDKFDFPIADKIANRVSDILSTERSIDSVVKGREVAKELAQKNYDNIAKNIGFLENSLMYPMKKDIGELVDLARQDVSFSPDGTIGSVVAQDGLTYKQIGDKFVANVNNSQAISDPDSFKGVVSSSLVYENEAKNIYALAGTTRGVAGSKKVVEFMNGVIWSNKLKTSGVTKLGVSMEDLVKLDEFPKDSQELAAYAEKYNELYNGAIANFGINDDVTKYIGIKKSMINQYSALRKTTDDVQYFKALGDISSRTYDMVQANIDTLNKLVGNKKLSDAEKISKANEMISKIRNNFTKGIEGKDVKKIIKDKNNYIIPGSNQPRGFAPLSVNSVAAIRTFSKALESSARDMSMEVLSNNVKYSARLSEGNRMLTELRNFASNGIASKSFSFDNIDNLSKYGDKPFAFNVQEMIWKKFNTAKENFYRIEKTGVPVVSVNAVESIKESVASVIAGRYGVDKSVVKDGISVDYVKPTVAQVSYIDPDGVLRSHYIDTNLPEEIKNYYQFALTRDEILEGKQVSFRIGGAGEDMASHTATIDGSKYNGLLDQQLGDSIDMLEGDKLLPVWEQAAKKSMGSEYVKGIMESTYVPKIFSFLMENKAVLRESAYDTYKIVSEYDRVVTNFADKASELLGHIESEAPELKKFGEVYNANIEYVKALVLGKRIIPKGMVKIRGVVTDSLEDIKKAFDSTTYKLEDFALENGIHGKEIDALNKSIVFGKKNMRDFGQYAGVKYFLDKTYGKNVLTEYKGVSTDMIDSMLGFYADEFKSIYDTMGAKIDKDQIAKKLEEYLMNKKSLNIAGFDNDIRGGFTVFESITEDLRKANGGEGLTTIYDSMLKGSLDAEQRDRIYKDLMGESLRGKSSLMKFISRMRGETYALQLGRWSPKAYMIGLQNVVSNAVEVFSKRETYSGTAKEVMQLNDRLLNSKYFKDIIEKCYGPDGKTLIGLDIVHASKGKNLEIGGVSAIERGINKIVDTMDHLRMQAEKSLGIEGKPGEIIKKVTGKEPSKESVKAFANNPIGIADSFMQGDITNSFVYNKIFDELGTSPKTLNGLIDSIEVIDKQLEGLKGLDRQLLEAQKIDMINTVKNTMQYASREALFEYQQIFKAGSMAGLMRNGFSKRTWFTFFSSWGAKKSGEYLYNAMYKPFASAHLAYKRGGMGAVGKTLANELLTNTHWNALVKQSLYAARSTFQLNKDSNLDTVGEDNFGEWFMTVSPLGQAIKSFFITRAINEGVSQYGAAREEGLGIADSVKYGLSNAIYQASSQLLKDVKFFTGPLALALKESSTKGSEGDVFNSTVDKIANSFMTSMYYSMYDMYKGLPSDRLDGDTMYPFLDAVMGDTVTKYRYDMDKMMNAVYVENSIDKGELTVDWLGQLSSGLLGFPKTYNKRFALDQMDAIKRDDKIFKAIAGGDLKSVINDKQFPIEMKSTLMKSFMEQNMVGEFDQGNEKGKIDGKVALILNELKSNGVDTQDLAAIISSGNLKSAQKEMAILAASGMTKAESTTILAFMANNAYKEISDKYTKMKVPLSKNPQIKEDIYRQLFDVVMPTATEIDKQVASQVLFGYVQSAYGGKIPGLKQVELNPDGSVKAGGGTDPDTIKMFKLGLLADVADSETVAFNRGLLTSAGQRVLQDTPDEQVAKKTAEMFQFVDELKTVSDNGKMVAKAAMLYGNLDRMKLLLNSNYAPGMQDEMNKLADIIRDTNEKLQCTPELLNALTHAGGSGTGKKVQKPKSIELQKDVIAKVNDLADAMPTKLKSFALSLKSQRINATLKALSLPTLKPEKNDTYTASKLTPIGGGDIKTASIKTAESKGGKSTPKIKTAKPGKTGPVSNSGIKRPTPIKIQRVKKAE